LELTLALSTEDAARLPRLPVVRSARAGRSRGQAVRLVWHDTPDRALAAEGIVLAEQRGTWRLEQHRPAPTEPWPPAMDHRLLEQSSQAGGFSHDLPRGLTPVAAFEGRHLALPLTLDGGTVSLTLSQGALRAVAAERHCARLALAGQSGQVRKLALLLSDVVALSVPEQSLAQEAMALADGVRAAPRREGAPILPTGGLSISAAFAHIVGHLADILVHLEPSAADLNGGPEAVHQMRVAVRRMRSAFALFPGQPENPCWKSTAEALKRLGQMLGPARDWDVFMTETIPPVAAGLPEQAGLMPLLRAGARRRRGAREMLREYLASPGFRALCVELACLAGEEPAEPDPMAPTLAEFAVVTLRNRWKKLLNAGRSMDELDDAGLHGMRLKAKRLRYAAEFFAPLFPHKQAGRFIRRLAVLQDRLGLFNDTRVAEALLRELGPKPGYAAGLVMGFTATRGIRARPRIAGAWAKLRRRDPFWE
jgi:triphosphatase